VQGEEELGFGPIGETDKDAFEGEGAGGGRETSEAKGLKGVWWEEGGARVGCERHAGGTVMGGGVLERPLGAVQG
jgi:hypothetical protein